VGTTEVYRRGKLSGPESARDTVGAAVRRNSSAAEARADGYDQLLVDAVRSASVAFAIALSDGSSQCGIQPSSSRGPQPFGGVVTVCGQLDDERRR
jgi:hypothetical protein